MLTNSRLLFVSHSNGMFGAELCLTEAVHAIKLQGIHAIDVLMKPGGNSLEELLMTNGANIKHFDNIHKWVGTKTLDWRQKLMWLKRNIITLREVIASFRKQKPDYVITNTVVCSPIFAIAAKLSGCKHVWYIHELGDKDHEYSFYFGRRLTWFIIKLFSDKIIVNSRFTLEYFSGKKTDETNSKIKVIYYAVPIEDTFAKRDTCFFDEIEDKWKIIARWKFLVAGRTVKGKGQEDIVNALGILKNVHKVEDFQLTILGQVEGDYSKLLDDLILKHGLEGHVKMVPFTQNTIQYFKEAHIGITTSRNEAFGRITVEYLKSNMIAIGANAGATGEIIENKVNGYTYELNRVDQLAGILLEVIKDKKKAAHFAANARAITAKKFNLEKYGYELKTFL
jgi:glycosyltransferase involved in cell wall biosynthesis